MLSVHIAHAASKIIEFYYDFRKELLTLSQKAMLLSFKECQKDIESEFYAIEFDILKVTNFANPPDSLPINAVLSHYMIVKNHIKT